MFGLRRWSQTEIGRFRPRSQFRASSNSSSRVEPTEDIYAGGTNFTVKLPDGTMRVKTAFPPEPKHRRKGIRRTLLRSLGLGVLGVVSGTIWYSSSVLARLPSEYLPSNACNDSPPSREEEAKATLEALQQGRDPSQVTDRKPYEKIYKWENVADSLRPGDVVLMMGTGGVSNEIVTISYFYAGYHTRALRYSHVGVIWEPPKSEAIRAALLAPAGQGATKSKKVVYALESIDNKDVKAEDYRGDVRLDQVQLTDVGKRMFGKEKGRWCYSRCAVRRLHGVAQTPDLRARMDKVLSEVEGRPLNTRKTMILAYVSEALYYAFVPRELVIPDMSCGQLVAEVYRAMKWTDPAKDTRSSLTHMPSHFTELGGVGQTILPFRDTIRLGPEIRIALPGAKERIDPTDPYVLAEDAKILEKDKEPKQNL